MEEDHRLGEIKRQLHSFTKSPSLKHIRDPYSIARLAGEILAAVDRKSGPWHKWDSTREAIVKAAAPTFIPVGDLRDCLNALPGAQLTMTDVAQRLKAIQEDGYGLYPTPALEATCREIFVRERELGTELIAIIFLLEEIVETKREELRLAHEKQWRESQLAERAMMQQRLLSGADCKWTSLDASDVLFCRVNGRLFQLRKDLDKRWRLCRVQSVDETSPSVIGVYSGRREATKVVQGVAYQPEPRW